jgi:hypothetical protein
MESVQLTCSLADFDGSCMSECKAEKLLHNLGISSTFSIGTSRFLR